MKRGSMPFTFLTPTFWLTSVVITMLALAGAQAVGQLGGTDLESVIRGGKLYDNWIGALGVKAPETNQPLWALQTTNTRTGAGTWRCRECHGFDYKGKDGDYGAGTHLTGFPGVLGVQLKSTAKIIGVLKGSSNPKHDFSKVLAEKDLNDLANFLKNGLFDMKTLIDSSSKQAIKGDAKAGQEVYARCVACHGADGKLINFGSDTAPNFVAGYSKDNPWGFIHRVQMGMPGTPMPAQFGQLTDKQLQDLLAHAQTLSLK
jgi:cytochrome c553